MTTAVSADRLIRPFHLDVDAADRGFLHGALDRILDTGTLILGPYTEEFERRFADYVGTRFAVSVNTATSALEIQLRLNGAAGRLVAVPTNTNYATAAAVLHAGGQPVFVDMDSTTFMPSVEHLRQARRQYPALAGVVWVHIGGVISPEMEAVARYCREHGMFLIEDCAHAHGSMLGGRQAGRFGSSGAYSFFPTKVMTTMEGGMLVTDDEEFAALARSYRNQGKRAGNYNALHVDPGGSWRLSEIGAALGISQLNKLDRMLATRARVAAIYQDAFRRLGLPYVNTGHMERCSHYKVMATLPEHIAPADAKRHFLDRGIVLGGAVYEVPLHAQPVFAALPGAQGAFPVADRLCPRQLCLPITSGMGEQDAERVVQALAALLEP
jgi:perosamine synthetase